MPVSLYKRSPLDSEAEQAAPIQDLDAVAVVARVEHDLILAIPCRIDIHTVQPLLCSA